VKLSFEGALILLIGGTDLITTVWLVHLHGAAEGNPMMRFFLAQGVVAFAAVKAAFCLGPVVFLEWARRHRPILVRRALRIAIALYACAYALGVWGVNRESVAVLYADSHENLALSPPGILMPQLPSGSIESSSVSQEIGRKKAALTYPVSHSD
jgi:hypothetical protein